MRNSITIVGKLKEQRSVQENIIDFYNKATEDYRFWSKDMNMHFGYFVPFKTCVFRRDVMLNKMSDHLFSLLNIEDKKAHVADLGCGVGATIKRGINTHPKLAMTGCTISDFQVEFGNKFIDSERASIIKKDYRKTGIENNSMDGALAIESFCHSACSFETLKESHRILKPEAKLVISDAFIKRDKKRMNPVSRKVHDGLCEKWSLEGLGNIHEVKKDLQKLGFKNIKIKNIWYRVAPSVLHVPFVSLQFFLKNFFNNKRLTKESIDNVKGSVYALLSGLCLSDFGYYTIEATK